MNDVRSRWLEPLLARALSAMPVVVVTGARQTGKTTLANTLAPNRLYLTFDEIEVLAQAERDPDSLLAELPVTLDEVQRVPEVLLAVKRRVDKVRKPGSVLLTGSANLALMQGVSDSLAGRAIYLDLPPFCPAEWRGNSIESTGLNMLFQTEFSSSEWPRGAGAWVPWVARGGYPDALKAPSDAARELWFAGYVQTYLERDLRQMSNVGSLVDFQRLMRLLAAQTARVLNQSNLARDVGLPQPTAHRYLNLLETGCMIARLQNYQRSAGKSAAKARKVFWRDTGLAAWLAGVPPGAVASRADAGFWLEQVVFQTLQSWAALDVTRRVHYWREGDAEVDFVLEEGGEIVGLEVKTARRIGPEDLRGARAFQTAFTRNKTVPRVAVLHLGDENRFLGGNAWALGLKALLPE
ncbi:MAG: ATP-binding protein [Cephaloticoccus sp.]|nr:ATP-binding protein [Cephaloticoccus sp.]